MQYEVIIDVVSNFLMMLGAVVVAFGSYGLYCVLKLKIKQAMQRQSKIRCLCEHEYEFQWHIYYGRDLDEYCYVCRKCNKVLKFKVADKSEAGE
jgi:hypothetical protein